MGAAGGRRNGVAISVDKPVVTVGRPIDRPFHAADPIGRCDIAAEGGGRQSGAVGQHAGQKIGETTWIMQHRVDRRVIAGGDQFGGAAPTNFNALEEIGFRARQAIETGGAKLWRGAKDFGVGVKSDRGAAAVGGGANRRQGAFGVATAIFLAVQRAVAGDLDRQPIGQGVDH